MFKIVSFFLLFSFVTNHTFAVKPKKQDQEKNQNNDEKKDGNEGDSLDDKENKEKKSQFFHFPAAASVLHSS